MSATRLISIAPGDTNEARYAQTYWAVALAGFANPKFVAPNNDDSTGFPIADARAVIISFENGATSTLVHEQTLDPTGQTGWFTVVGKALNSTSGQISSGYSNGNGFVFPATGIRHRIRVTALTVQELRVRIALSDEMIDLSTSSGVLANVGSTVNEDSAATSSSAIGIALEARNNQKTSMSATGDVVRAQGTMDGRQVIRLNNVPELDWTAVVHVENTTTAVLLKAAAGTGVRNYLTNIHISHWTLGSPADYELLDGTTVIFRGVLLAGQTEGFDIQFPTPLKTSANAALNIRTGAAVTGIIRINAQGYTGP